MSNWKTIDLLTPEDQTRARKLFTPEEGDIIGSYEFSDFGPKMMRRVIPALVVDHAKPEPKAKQPLRQLHQREAAPPSEAIAPGDRILRLPLSQLMPSPLNPRTRYCEKALQELAGNVRALGIVQSLLVRPAGEADAAPGFLYEVVAGHRRLRAAFLAELTTVPVQVREISDNDALDLMLSENLQRVDLNPIEEAEGLAQWLALKEKDGSPRTKKDAADRLGKTEQHVDHCLRLLRLPKAAREALEANTIGAAIGYLIAKVPTGDMRKRLADEVLRGNGEQKEAMSKREVIDHIRRSYMVELRGSPFDQRDVTLVPIKEKEGERIAGGACTDCPLNTANMQDGDERGVREEKKHGGRAPGEAQLCTNPSCYQAKLSEHVQGVKAQALSAGKLVVEGEKVNRYIYHDGTPQSDSGMIRLDASPSASEVAGSKQAPPWKKMLSGKASSEIVMSRNGDGESVKGKVSGNLTIPVTVVIDGKGKAHELVPRKLAIEAAKKNGYEDLFSARAGRAKSSGQAEQMERDSAEREKQKLESATASAALGDLVAEISKRGLSADAWLAVLDLAIFHAGADGEAFVCQRRELDVKKHPQHGQPDREKALRAHADTLPPERIPALAIELMLGGWMKHRGVDSPGFQAFAKVYGVDVKAIKARVKVEITEKKKPKAKPKVDKPEVPVRDLIAELSKKRKLSLLDINRIAQEVIGKNYEFAKGHELTAILTAIKAMPVPPKGK